MNADAAASELEDPRLRDLLQRAARLPSPPAIVLALLGSLGDERSSIGAITGHAERDQALTARLLRIANSSYYGLAGRVATVRDAALVMGVNNVRNLALATGVINAYPRLPGAKDSLGAFWRHGLMAAFCGAALASRCEADEGLAFTAGLLHDVGKLVLAGASAEHAPSADAVVPDALERERAHFGIDHAALGARIARQWRFPAPICEALHLHHSAGAPEPLARIIRHADLLAHALTAPGAPGEALRQAAEALAEMRSKSNAPELLAQIERQSALVAELVPGA